MTNRRPEDVFTPKTIASREMFSRRNEADLNGVPGLQDSLTDALHDRGGQVVVYGDTGAGKSSLVRYATQDEGMDMVIVNCLSSHDFTGLLDDALKSLVDFESIEKSNEVSVGASVEGKKNIFSLISFTGTLRGEGRSTEKISVVKKPLTDALLHSMKKSSKSILCLENFQNISDPSTRALVAELIESLSDRSEETNDIKVVVVGIASDVTELVGKSGSVQRRIAQVGVPRMPYEEILEILKKGFHLLDLDVSSAILESLVELSDGFPYFAHTLGLHVSRAARRAQRSIVSFDHVDTATATIVRTVEASYISRVNQASELSGNTQPRKRLMQALSNSNKRSWYGKEVVDEREANFGPAGPPQFIYVALSQLASPQKGEILSRTGNESSYRYQFKDPYLKPFLRIYFSSPNPTDGS